VIDAIAQVWEVLHLPLIAALIALASHVPLGEQVLKRGIVFIDLAIAQVAALGVLVANSQGVGGSMATATGVLMALAGAWLIATLARRSPDHREALIGLVYVGAAALSVLWVSADPHGAQKLRAVLAGDVLWVNAESVWPLALASLLLILALRAKPRLLEHDLLFYPVFALVISLSVPVLGLYLVFTALIAPALGAWPLRQRGYRHAGLVAFGAGSVGVGAGLFASFALDLPSGPCIVLSLVVAAGTLGIASAGRLTG
jgi:zinc/manganese transport system permease protein